MLMDIGRKFAFVCHLNIQGTKEAEAEHVVCSDGLVAMSTVLWKVWFPVLYH
jgi:hypothetical protein